MAAWRSDRKYPRVSILENAAQYLLPVTDTLSLVLPSFTPGAAT